MSTGGAGHFRTPEQSLGDVDARVAAQLIAAAADIALVINEEGVIIDLSSGESELVAITSDLVGRSWVDTVTTDSRAKVEQLLSEANARTMTRAREINQKVSSDREIPVRYSGVCLGRPGHVLVVGRDLRSIANLQQQLVSA